MRFLSPASALVVCDGCGEYPSRSVAAQALWNSLRPSENVIEG